jgi:membrane protease YdiL (CAAX protease family)
MLIDAAINQVSVNLSGLLSTREFPHFNIITIFLYNLLFFGFGEEVGWRGFALPRFQKRFNALQSTVILTFLWALWHWPLFLYRPGYLSMEITGIIGWFFSLLTGGVLLTWLYNSTRGSILICAVFHATIDIPFTSASVSPNMMNYLGFLITVWGILILIVFKPRNLSKDQRVVGS